MNLETIVFGQGDGNPGEQLSAFVMQIKDLLSPLISDSENDHFFYDETRESMRLAWDSVERRFEDYAELVKGASTDDLENHGLTESELAFKFAAINFVAGRFYALGDGSSLGQRRRWLKKLLEIIDKLLKSILDAIPGGGAISEYKDFCESLIPDDHDD